jgi:hypothetical protein
MGQGLGESHTLQCSVQKETLKKNQPMNGVIQAFLYNKSGKKPYNKQDL